jgi:N-acetylgalactosamine kinase
MHDIDFVPKSPHFMKVTEWLKELGNNKGWLMEHFHEIYGEDQSIINSRKLIIKKALERFGSTYGTDRDVVITKSPCRINLRGMHSEMQHATPNYLTHARTMAIVAGRRNDDIVEMNNVENEKFGERQFRISEEIGKGNWGTWTDYIDSKGVRESNEANRGDWANYIKAAVLKIQDSFPEKRLNGMDVVAYGDVPRGNGMSSSSTLVVSSGLAFMATNNLVMDRRELVVCLGQGEWFVGTRGGFGDHGAMIFGKRGHILHSVFLTVEEMQPEYIAFPNDHQVVIVNSYKTSTKSAERLFAYNQTMFAYSMAMTLIKGILKSMNIYSGSLIEQINFLGQITPDLIGLDKIYEILRNLPERISIDDLKNHYTTGELEKRLDRFFGQLKKYPESVDVRGPALWGIAESERSRAFAELIKNGEIRKAGELMYIGHDGDRIFNFDGNGNPKDFVSNKVTNEYLDCLIGDMKCNDPNRNQKAELARQPGDYDASSIELDMIVDIAKSVDGSVGASLTGAGFGGNVLAIIEKKNDVLNELKNALFCGYYEPSELEELSWFENDPALKSLYGDDFDNVKHRIRKIVQQKRDTKSDMEKTDIEFAESIQRKVNALFKEGKISREMMFIPANYYKDGIVVNMTSENAEVL